jgi:DNA polymerase III epsilon subunit-like protein
MRVLACCLKDYGIPAPACLPYACTVQMGRRCYPHLPNHKLNTLCDALGISLDHHRADSDSRACAELLLNYLDHGLNLNDFRRTFDMRAMCTVKTFR